jgi:photosynthetic reaction center H subunit
VVTTQTGARDAPVLKATRTSVVSGAPLEPVGDPLLAGVGPGSFAQRAKRVETMGHGLARIVPLRAAPGYSIDKADGKLIGLTVLGADGLPAGVVSDLWVDRMEFLVRYIEVELSPTLPQPGLTVVGSAPPARRVLAPMTMSVISRSSGTVQVEAILASQFAGVPTLGREDEITLDEEERVTAYFGGGYLYATPARAEPLI